MGPLRGLKRDIWEGGHRVPFIVRWPQVIKPGRVSDELISQIDLMATIAAVVGYHLPPDAADDSHNQLGLFKGLAPSPRKSLVHNTKANHYAIRKDHYVLIDAKSGNISAVPQWFDQANNYQKNNHPAALYDLRQDIAQRQNLYDQNPQKVQELKTLLNKTREHGEVRSQ